MGATQGTLVAICCVAALFVLQKAGASNMGPSDALLPTLPTLPLLRAAYVVRSLLPSFTHMMLR